jgi:hypothetical protein
MAIKEQLGLRHELAPRFAGVLKRTLQEGELLPPAAASLASPQQRVKRMKLTFVVTRFAFDSHCFERAIQATGVVEQRVAGPDRNKESWEGAIRSFAALEDVERIGQIELAGCSVVEPSHVRLVHALEDVVHPER